MNVYINRADNFSDMRGPCAEGFHVPLSTEMTNLINTGITLGAWTMSSGFNTYLKFPLAGKRNGSTGAVDNLENVGRYWCSDEAASTDGRRLYIISTGEIVMGTPYKYQGCSIRPFKDVSVVPDNSWTTLYQGAGGAGLFHNATLGVISISSDGTNWITIADKNLGATTVWNSGDTLSEANCGKYYQWGNNYGFPFTGSVTTSSTKVDASAYGPGNYYSSSTFITVSSWDSSNNANLRGGVTGAGGQFELKNAYIGNGLS